MSENPNPFSLAGKTIVVTGASSGIGRQCAMSCSRLGARLLIMGRNAERLKETMSSLRNEQDHLMYSLDLTDHGEVDGFINSVKTACGHIDGIVNCAGVSTTLPFRRVTPEKMNEFFNINVISAFDLCRRLIREKLITDSGSIIFLSSVMGITGATGKALYGMTKGALISGARSLALELAPKSIRVNCISPGVVVSPMSDNAIYSKDEESLQRIKNLHPLGLGEAGDVANACVYLLSDASRWITGTNLVIDGGYTAH
jgi:NAD(P)-dependent dehydrogenase (short-subunit alcohol dehydrogenase family)